MKGNSLLLGAFFTLLSMTTNAKTASPIVIPSAATIEISTPADSSISIEKVELLNEWEVAVEGRHTYLGRLGHEYRKRPFRAVILLHKGTEDTFTITFEKQSENQLMNTTYWEDTTQIFRYKH